MILQTLTRNEIIFLMQSPSRDVFIDRFSNLFLEVMQRAIEGTGHHQQLEIVEALKHHFPSDILEPLADDLWKDLICGELPENILQDIEENG